METIKQSSLQIFCKKYIPTNANVLNRLSGHGGADGNAK